MDPKKLDALMSSIYDEGDYTAYAKILLYGDPGAGKTTLGASIGRKILFLVADPGGWQALQNHPGLGLGTRVIPMKYRGISQLEALAEAFDEGHPKFAEYDTVMLDTLSNIAAMDLDIVQRQKMKKEGDEFDHEKHMYGVYNQNALRVKAAMLKLFLAPVNVIATAHMREVENKSTGVMKTTPMFSPAIFAAINGHCSLIGYMTANEAGVDSDGSVKYKRKMQVHPTRTIVAKTRIGGLPAVLENPNLKKIVADWQAKGGKLIQHETAEIEKPESEGLNPPLPKDPEATQDNSELTDFSI